jgi:hypothetical protein
MPHQASPDWLDKTGFGVIGKFTLNDGEKLIAEIVDYSEDTNELIIEPIARVATGGSGKQMTRAIEIDACFRSTPNHVHRMLGRTLIRAGQEGLHSYA